MLTACEKGYGKRTLFGPGTAEENDDADSESTSGSSRYRTQNRGGKGVRDIKTTKRNGKVIGIKSVNDDDQLLLMTSRGKIQRIKCTDVSIIGRNTQGVRIMGLDDDDTLAVIARVPRDEEDDESVENGGDVPTSDEPEDQLSTDSENELEEGPTAVDQPESTPGDEPENEDGDPENNEDGGLEENSDGE